MTRYVHDFDYLTIRGAGHMVPEYQSRSSLDYPKWLKMRVPGLQAQQALISVRERERG